MDIFFQDPNEVPLPPDEVRIRYLNAEPMWDRRRVKVYLEVEPFQQRPSAELTILDSQGQILASASIIESMIRKIEIIMHLRSSVSEDELTLKALLFYLDPVPEPVAAGDTAPELNPPRLVDQRQVSFALPVDEA